MVEYITGLRQRLRIKSDTLDNEISEYIKAALLDMKRSGADVTEADISNTLVFTCVEFYCKWLMNFEAEGEKYEVAYEKLRDSLSLSGKASYENNK